MSPLLIRLAHRVGSLAKKTIALGTIGALGGAGYQYNEIKQYDKARSGSPEKKVLVLPFHKMKVVEQKGHRIQDMLQKLGTPAGDEKSIEVEIRDLVNTIHAAAEDPNIVSIYGSFGQGFGFKSGGIAHIEEIRNAIKMFNESKRFKEKLSKTNENDKIGINSDKKKCSFAFADTFANPMDLCNNEYFLASAFSQIHLQNRGEMNLFGASASYPFLKEALDKYGIKVHVFKHGKYKNAPNIFTEKGYTTPHLNNTKSIVESLNHIICSSISEVRPFSDNFDNSTWKLLHDHGTMTAEDAREIGLVDYLTNIDPFDDLITANKDVTCFSKMQKKWGDSLNLDDFQASSFLSYGQYVSLLKKRKKAQEMKWKVHALFQDVARKYDIAGSIFSILGYEAPYFNMDKTEYDQHKSMQTTDKIALLHITGNITDSVAQKATASLRKIRKDPNTKCVVLRIDSKGGSVTASETILEQCRDLDIPIVCSFSNYAASGGYYIAMNSEKVFALPSTMTGSIGVFGIKIDATKFGKQNGFEFQHVTSGKHALTYSLFDPLTKAVRMNLLRNVDRVYGYFKEIVSEGRKLSVREVEEIAQGRVWTGEQAKEIGLIDEFGGIDQAISYAMKTYAKTGSANVEIWPRQPSLTDRIKEQMGVTSPQEEKQIMTNQLIELVMSGKVKLSSPLDLLLIAQRSQGAVLAMDEEAAISFILGNHSQSYTYRP